ncbi:hypothetical protein TRFO_36937 [Tritrichomonas foetus]|uniref:Glycosyltransferase 2-like domain-containing protein n=1 Tax=Tritrichomonas foetus TaxID=1144522 RepID=A0A1J4JC80_9EUKA|nr:hypothetical protein TRFO_36937 [Tritrichomonas foetus]|eukprot:OHS96810.1 hypothetical protein TRFO_36937 [Tritrichomonas foetus]
MYSFVIYISALIIISNVIPFFVKTKSLEKPRFQHETFTNFTFVSVPREPKTPTQFALLKMAVSNWILSSNNSRVILIINPKEFDVNHTLFDEITEDFGPGRLIYQTTLKTNRNNVPYINNWFESAVSTTPFNILTLINSDILLPPGWVDTINQIFEIFGETAFVTGYRLNFDIEDYSYILDRSFKDFNYTEYVYSCNHSEYSFRGMDFFTFMNHPGSNFFKTLPPFLMGKYEWDNWLVGKMNQLYQTITLGPNYRTYHINHPATANKRFTEFSLYNKRLRILYYTPTSDNEHTKWTVKNRTTIVSSDGKTVLRLN